MIGSSTYRLQNLLLSMGCKYGQEVIPQTRVIRKGRKKETWLFVYDAETKKLIGKRRLKGDK